MSGVCRNFKYGRCDTTRKAQTTLRTQPPEKGTGPFGPVVLYSPLRSGMANSFPHTVRRASVGWGATSPSRGRSRHTEQMETDITETRDANWRREYINYPRLVRVVRPPENCTDHQNSQYGRGANPGWSVGPTQIRYCGSVERSEDTLHPTSITLQLPITVGPADHPRFSPALSPDYRWSVQKSRGRTTRTTVGGVIG